MTRRERLMATLRGEAVDRPTVSFYEIGGKKVDPDDTDEFNIYNDPSWRPLLELAEEHTDLIRMRGPILTPTANNPQDEFFRSETYTEDGSLFSRTTLTVGGREMTKLTRRDPHVDTVWTLEHLLKDTDDLKAYLELPGEVFDFDFDVSEMVAADEKVGEAGIVMGELADPICCAAPLLSLGDFTVMAMMEQELFGKLMDKLAEAIHQRTRALAGAFPGHLWRICGPEYATEPYLPPHLFDEYVVRYTAPMVRAIQNGGGFARIHCHGRLKSALPLITEKIRPDAIDPVEPPPQGDMELADVRRQYGSDMVLMGNLEISDIETLAPDKFEKIVAKSLVDGTAGAGRGFVLMPSASPYGRTITPQTMANYETIVRLATN